MSRERSEESDVRKTDLEENSSRITEDKHSDDDRYSSKESDDVTMNGDVGDVADVDVITTEKVDETNRSEFDNEIHEQTERNIEEQTDELQH